jgi:hypothetical protein
MLLDVRPDFAGRPEPNPVGWVLGIVAQSLNLSCADGTLNLGGSCAGVWAAGAGGLAEASLAEGSVIHLHSAVTCNEIRKPKKRSRTRHLMGSPFNYPVARTK